MERDCISHSQWRAMVWAGLMAPMVELLPGVALAQAGKGAWLSVLLAWAGMMAVGGFLIPRWRVLGGYGNTVCRALGPAVGKGVLVVYLLWGECLAALRLRLCAQRLLSAGERDGSLWFFLPAAALLALWMARGKLTAFARAAQIFWGILLTTMAAVLLLSLSQMRGELLLPVWWDDVPGILLAVPSVLGVLCYGVYGGFLLGRTEAENRWRREWIRAGAWMGGLVVLGQVVIIGSLGVELAARLNSPFFTLAKSAGVEGAFQRVESVVAAVWTLADLTLLVLLLFALWEIVGRIFPRARQKVVVTGAILPAAAIGMAAFPDGFTAEQAGSGWLLVGNLVLGLAVPILLAGFLRVKEKS